MKYIYHSKDVTVEQSPEKNENNNKKILTAEMPKILENNQAKEASPKQTKNDYQKKFKMKTKRLTEFTRQISFAPTI